MIMEIKKSLIRNKKALLFVTYHPFAGPLAVAQVEEFKELGRAGGLLNAGLSYQVVKQPHPATFIGAGKVHELKKMHEESACFQLVVFDCSLSGVQIRNLERELKVAVMDRDQLILDIFAQRARTYEGKLQVELARVLDELPRMVGAWMSSLSRQGGGIGLRGPGEKAIEKDRRQARRRARGIKQKLEKIRRARKEHRALRKKNKIPSVALIGYTNSGKSTLLNSLSQGESAQVENLPFMTLDPTTRKVYISSSQSVLVTDTVGFIQNLSPHLIEAFKATLEESASADILLHIIDLSSPLMTVQMDTVNRLIREFGWDQKPCLHVYNKMDIAPKEKAFQSHYRPHGKVSRAGLECGKPLGGRHICFTESGNKNRRVYISALTGAGTDKLKALIEKTVLKIQTKQVQLYFSKNEEDKIYSLSRSAFIDKKETSSLGTLCHARLKVTELGKWKNFIIKNL